MVLFEKCMDTRTSYIFCPQCKKFNWSASKIDTTYKCRICNVTYGHDTTYTPVYCEYCAKKSNICQRCGKSLE